jgi:hypothetical protein
MSSIYRGASHVLVWPQLQHWIYELPDLDLNTPTEEISAINDVLKLSEDVYFSLPWVVQEIMLARKVHIMFGNGRISLKELRRAINISNHASWSMLSTTKAYNLSYTNELRPVTLQKCIEMFCQNDCEDPRDRVYGLMGMVYEDEQLEIDYLKSTYEIYSNVVASFCSSYIRHLAQPTQTQDADRPSIYASRKRQGYLLSALLLSGGMGFT